MSKWTDEGSILKVMDWEGRKISEAILLVCTDKQITDIEAVVFPDAKVLKSGAYKSQRDIDAVRVEFSEGVEVEAEKAKILKRAAVAAIEK